MTIPPEPVSLQLWEEHEPPASHRAWWEACARPLRHFSIPEASGYAFEIGDAREFVYALEHTEGQRAFAPGRLCGPWDPTVATARQFFLNWEPDAALHLVAVHEIGAYIGKLTFPSGWAASPWFAHRSRAVLRRQLHDFAAAFFAARVEPSHPLGRNYRSSEPKR